MTARVHYKIQRSEGISLFDDIIIVNEQGVYIDTVAEVTNVKRARMLVALANEQLGYKNGGGNVQTQDPPAPA